MIAEGMAGCHTKKAAAGLRLGIILFIIREAMFFVSFFWAFFHRSLSPRVQIGCMWPPVGIEPINCWGEPLLNTVLLVSSAFFVTWAHHALLARKFRMVCKALRRALGLGVLFMLVQVKEYYERSFSIADGVYGSCFFMLTGLHGFHVFVGGVFLFI